MWWKYTSPKAPSAIKSTSYGESTLTWIRLLQQEDTSFSNAHFDSLNLV